MKRLSLYRYSLSDWKKKLPSHQIRGQPVQKSADEMISAYDTIKVKDLHWINKIDSRVHRNIETDLKYQPYTDRMKKVIHTLMQEIELLKKNQ